MSRFSFSGIYELLDLRTDRRYVGASLCMLHRAKQHRNGLRSGHHHCPELIDAFKAGKLVVLFVGDDGRPLYVQEAERIALWRDAGKCMNVQGAPEWREKVSARVKKQHEDGRFGRQTWKETK